MATQHLSLRIDSGSLERLRTRSRQTGRTQSDLAKTFIEEGLRMDAHPGIVFRPGPAGRRPALAAGPDVWELVRFVRDLDAKGDAAIEEAGELLSLAPGEVRTALRYYAEFPDEIDEWTAWAEEEAERAERAALRERDALA